METVRVVLALIILIWSSTSAGSPHSEEPSSSATCES